MKITKAQLKQIIKEEIGELDEGVGDFFKGIGKKLGFGKGEERAARQAGYEEERRADAIKDLEEKIAEYHETRGKEGYFGKKDVRWKHGRPALIDFLKGHGVDCESSLNPGWSRRPKLCDDALELDSKTLNAAYRAFYDTAEEAQREQSKEGSARWQRGRDEDEARQEKNRPCRQHERGSAAWEDCMDQRSAQKFRDSQPREREQHSQEWGEVSERIAQKVEEQMVRRLRKK